MEFIPIKTNKIKLPKTDLYSVIDDYLPQLKEKDILFVASKVVAIHQWRCVHTSEKNKLELIQKESDKYIVSDSVSGYDIHLTIKNNILIPSAGIDESNSDWWYILRPETPSKFAKELNQYLQKKYNIKDLAVIITDSVATMLRKWMINQAIGMFGMIPIKNYFGEKDIFGRRLNFERLNVLDSISAVAGLYMWEWNEQTPFVIWRNIPNIDFTNQETYEDVFINLKDDIYRPLLEKFNI